VKFAFIAQMDVEKAFPIAFMCRMLDVSRQGFYQWRNRPPSARALRDGELVERIRKIHEAHGGRVGVRRVRDELARAGVLCSHKRTHRLMRASGLRCVHPRPYKRTTESGRFNPALADLVGRDWSPPQPDLVWVGDITYIKTWTGWAYLATVIDCYARRVVGWAIAEHMRTDLIIDALRMAIIHRNPKRVTFHSDYAELCVKPRDRGMACAGRVVLSDSSA
jgi:transposase InsO family protein